MDRSTSAIYIDTRGCSDRVIEFLPLLARIKGLEPRTYDENVTESRPAVYYRFDHIDGICAIVHFINEIRPYPELIPGEPVARAYFRAITERLLEGEAYDELWRLYVKNPRGVPFARGRRQPTIVDLAIVAAARCDAQRPPTWVLRLTEELEAFIASDHDEMSEEA